MSVFYLGSEPRTLADKLVEHLDQHLKTGDLLQPVTIVVPNRYVRQWLRLWLARRLDIAANLDFQYLEDALWSLLKELDPSAATAPPEPIDDNVYRLLVLSVLFEEKDPHLALLRRYLQMQDHAITRLTCRRAWNLADRLGLLIRDYEYDRQDALIQHWLKNELGLSNATDFQRMMERSQRALFTHITREPDGKRALLNKHGENAFKTFPQYAMEQMTAFHQPSRSADATPRTIHFFGFTHVCELHARTIAWLGQRFDLRFYHLNVLADHVASDARPAAFRALAQSIRDPAPSDGGLLPSWGRAGAESLDVMATLGLPIEALSNLEDVKARRSGTVLTRLRDHLLGNNAKNSSRCDQDTSLQIVACPGISREVETVYDSIVHNLQSDPSLRQNDIAVLVTDMPKYRAALHAVFERPPRRLQYSIVDFSAAGVSMFGQAVLGMLDLALESFSRSRVFEVILNPCFLTRLGVDRGQAMTWLDWAESLGIYQGWDAEEKHQQGYARTPLYGWRLGLQRLRLGRFMDVTDERGGEPACRFEHVVPYADLASGEREHLDPFCRAVEGMLPTLTRLRSAVWSGARWANQLTRLVQEFLEVPEDRPEEAQVRDLLVAALGKLELWDRFHDSKSAAGIPLALVREYVQSQLDVLPGNKGDYLLGGVTIAALQPMRPLPFAVVYLLGLGEDSFPGSNALSSFDLRGAERLPGDVRPAEQRLYDFLATILSAQQKLYLLYNSHDVQKDQALQPAVPLQQLKRFLRQNVIKAEFQETPIPAHADDVRFLDPALQPDFQDVLIQTRDADRCLALATALEAHHLALDKKQQGQWAAKCQNMHVAFSIPSAPQTSTADRVVVSLSELKRFLQLPAREALRRHLRVEEDEEQTIEDDEPLVTCPNEARTLIRQTLQNLVMAAGKDGADAAIARWKGCFAGNYADARLRCRVPDEAFGEIDQASLMAELQDRIHGAGNLEAFLRERSRMEFCGPILLGESLTPIGAKVRFPGLMLRPGHELPEVARTIRIVGWTPFAWQAPGRLEFLTVTTSKEFDGYQIHASMLEPALFHLALLANKEPGEGILGAERWVAPREVVLHVAHRGGIQSWTHPPASITPDEALAYFVDLTREFLDPTQFDLLPLDLLLNNKELQLSLRADFQPRLSPADFQSLLEDAIADARENSFGTVQLPPLVEMARARVPVDALAKVQRRFRLLDRGPARMRQQPKVKTRKAATS